VPNYEKVDSAEALIERRLGDLESACRRAGARVTHQRREVLRAVVETDMHPDAHSVLQRVRRRMPTISFDTVYRTLSFLEEHDLIGRVPATGERVRFDGNRAPHHHFICTQCGKIVDFESKKLDRIALPADVNEIGTPASRQMQVFGVCRACESQEQRHDG
jgi:Fur family transcriptional regulator, peroxide stress response regulator